MTTKQLPAKTKTNNPAGPAWSVEDREDALSLLALHNGTATVAAKEFSEITGRELSPATLRSWKSRHRERYEEISHDLTRRIKQRSAENHSRLAERAAAVVSQMVDRLEREGTKIETDKLPAAAKALSTVSGIHTDKARDLRGDPSVVEHRSALTFDQLARSLQAKGVELVIESTAEEIMDADEAPE